MKYKSIFTLLFVVLCTSFMFANASITVSSATKIDPTHDNIQLAVTVPEHDAYYADYFSFSTDDPDVIIDSWHTSTEPISKYDTTFKTTKNIFTKPFSITVRTRLAEPSIDQYNLYVGYYQQSKKQNNYAIFPISFQKTEPVAVSTSAEQPSLAPSTPTITNTLPRTTWSLSLSNLLQTTESWWLRLLLSLILGMLLSLTPCIYPMIPITMGILQAQASRSLRRNFLLSLSYTMGIAFTFAALGIMAAFTGKLFGSIMNNPFVILFIVALLVYLSGSMLGIYELYIPRFLQPSHRSMQGGSLFTAFLFGAMSGTVASPCLSPGLLLLLTLVTSTGNVIAGFALLFVFGVGLGIPLLIIGTFSGSLSLLPRAGQWMIDIKQLFGFIMLASCFYFLNIILPSFIVAWAVALFTLTVGIFYLYTARNSRTIHRIKNISGIILVALSIHLFFNAYKATDIHFHQPKQNLFWLSDFQEGLQVAQKQHKLLLLDIGAAYCSICKAIDQKLFADPRVIAMLHNFVTVKIDDIEKNDITKAVQKQFNVLGAPTIILLDPEQQQEVRRWGAELYDYSADEFIATLAQSQGK